MIDNAPVPPSQVAHEAVQPALAEVRGEGILPPGSLPPSPGRQGLRQPHPLGSQEGPVARGPHKPPGFPEEALQAHKPGGGCQGDGKN